MPSMSSAGQRAPDAAAAHVLNIMGSAQAYPELAKRIANGFNNRSTLFPWFAVPEEADAYLTRLAA